MFGTVHEKIRFLYKFTRYPGQIGSIMPSSVWLAEKMTTAVPWNEVRYAAELGAGTGAVTRRIDAVKEKHAKVLLFEKDTDMRKQLARLYPSYSCHEDACMLRRVLREEGIPELDCVLSGLPFFNFTQPVRDMLLDEIAASLRPGGWLVAFQYSTQMRKQLSRKFELEQIHFVPWNIPPAFVYVCRNRRHS
jgi:phospholipid N-methyltransferase